MERPLSIRERKLIETINSLDDGQITRLVTWFHEVLRNDLQFQGMYLPQDGFLPLLSPRLSIRLGRQVMRLFAKTPELAELAGQQCRRLAGSTYPIERLEGSAISSLARFYATVAGEHTRAVAEAEFVLRQIVPSIEASTRSTRTRGGGEISEELPPLTSATPAPESSLGLGDTSPHANGPRWLNASIDGYSPGDPLRVNETRTLVIGVQSTVAQDAIASDHLIAEFPPGVDEVELTVILQSDDFSISSNSAKLYVPRVGASIRNAHFLLTPLHAGVSMLTALILRSGNYVQQLRIELPVEQHESLRPEEPSGRPLSTIASLAPRDLTLVIKAVGGDSFDCTAIGPTFAQGRLPIPRAQLADAIVQARAAIMDVITHRDDTGDYLFQAGIHIPAAVRDLAIKRLARAGFILFRTIFFGPAADAQSRRIGDWLLEQARAPSGTLKVQIVSHEFPVPWALLYLADEWDETQVDWECFLGMRHIVEQIPLQMNLSTHSPTMGKPGVPLPVSLSFNADIDSQMSADYVKKQCSYWSTAAFPGLSLRRTQLKGNEEFVAALRDTHTADELFYLYCHAETAGLSALGGPGASWLALSGGERLTLDDLYLRAPTQYLLRGAPLVFLNACESAELSPAFYDGFVPYFLAKGARGVIGTECKTPANFALEWSMAFFDRFFAGIPLGQAVFELRRRFFIQDGNPLGLMYAVYCDGDTVVARAAA
jgi:hypothetical protein